MRAYVTNFRCVKEKNSGTGSRDAGATLRNRFAHAEDGEKNILNAIFDDFFGEIAHAILLIFLATIGEIPMTKELFFPVGFFFDPTRIKSANRNMEFPPKIPAKLNEFSNLGVIETPWSLCQNLWANSRL